MALIRWCVRYPVSVAVGMILTVIFGVISLYRIPLQMTPTVDRPEITVETEYPGAAPQEITGAVRDDVKRFVGGASASDDLTLLALRWS